MSDEKEFDLGDDFEPSYEEPEFERNAREFRTSLEELGRALEMSRTGYLIIYRDSIDDWKNGDDLMVKEISQMDPAQLAERRGRVFTPEQIDQMIESKQLEWGNRIGKAGDDLASERAVIEFCIGFNTNPPSDYEDNMLEGRWCDGMLLYLFSLVSRNSSVTIEHMPDDNFLKGNFTATFYG